MPYFYYDSWNFNNPPILSEKEYSLLREAIHSIPGELDYEKIYFLVDPHFRGFRETYKMRLTSIAVGTAISVFLLLFISALPSSYGEYLSDIVISVVGLTFVIILVSFYFFAVSLPSFFKYKSKRQRYFKELSSALVESDDYQEFLRMAPNKPIDL